MFVPKRVLNAFSMVVLQSVTKSLVEVTVVMMYAELVTQENIVLSTPLKMVNSLIWENALEKE